MNLKVILVYVVLVNYSSFAQNINLEWVGAFDYHAEICTSIKSDINGDVYIAGSYIDSIDFDPGPDEIWHPTPFNRVYGFVLKLDSVGDFLWYRVWDGPFVEIYGLEVDNNNDIVVVGNFVDSIDLDPNINVTLEHSSSGGTNAFIVKLDEDGNYIWSLVTKGDLELSYYCVSVDDNNNIYCAGMFRDSIEIDPNSINSKIGSNGEQDIFLQKFDPSGSTIWYSHFGGSDEDNAIEIDTDLQGNLYVVGRFRDSVDFDTGAGDQIVSAGILGSGFIVKYDFNGQFEWVNDFYGNYGSVTGVAVASTGDVYAIGRLRGNGYFISQTDTMFADYCQSSSCWNTILSKFASDGTLIWGRNIGNEDYTDGITQSYSITTDSLDNLYAIGQIAGSVGFDSPNPVLIFNSIGNSDICIFKFYENGAFAWVEQMGSPNSGFVSGPNSNSEAYNFNIDLDEDGNIFASGLFTNEVDFDPGPDSSIFTTSLAAPFFMKFGQPSLLSVEAELDLTENELLVFPNPGKSIVNLRLDNTNSSQVKVSLFEINGEHIKTINCFNLNSRSFEKQIDVSGLNPGVYVIRISSQGIPDAYGKLIVQ